MGADSKGLNISQLLGWLLLAAAVCCAIPAKAQIVTLPDEKMNVDSLRRAFADTHYYFGLYKDNYFIFGPPVGKKPTSDNTNVKFQISVAQKLTKNTLPWGTYLYLYYTQKVFWNILENSMPMTDLNFNPGIGLAKPWFIKDRFVGRLSLQLEHESNGRDGEESRSWNKLSFGGSVMVDPNFVVFGKYWIPIVDGVNNKDILHYCGIYQFGFQVQSVNRKVSASLTLVKRKGNIFNYNVILEAAYRFRVRATSICLPSFIPATARGCSPIRNITSSFASVSSLSPPSSPNTKMPF